MNNRKNTGRKRAAALRKAAAAMLTVALMAGVLAVSASAATPTPGGGGFSDDVSNSLSNLSNFLFGIVRILGGIFLAFGVLQIGMSIKSHDPTQRAQGFLTFAGGLVVFFAKEILRLVGVDV